MTRKQRSRKHERRVQHQLAQRARLRAALTASLGAGGKVAEQMYERGYAYDVYDARWHRVRPELAVATTRRGPSWAGILSKRKRKRK